MKLIFEIIKDDIKNKNIVNLIGELIMIIFYLFGWIIGFIFIFNSENILLFKIIGILAIISLSFLTAFLFDIN